MAVSKLTQAQKEMIRLNYTSKRMNIKEMAAALEVSPRTIGRVLEELSLASPVPRLRGEAYTVMSKLKTAGIEAKDIDKVLARFKNGMTEDDFLLYALKLSEVEWSVLLQQAITARVAKFSNVHVQTRMLQLEEKVKANERDNEARK